MPPSEPATDSRQRRETAGRRLREAVWRGDRAAVAAALDLDG